jgi:hypothetical protein
MRGHSDLRFVLFAGDCKYTKMAGAVGFEPTIHDTKNRCLTTWPRPNPFGRCNLAIKSLAINPVLALEPSKMWLIFQMLRKIMIKRHLSAHFLLDLKEEALLLLPKYRRV